MNKRSIRFDCVYTSTNIILYIDGMRRNFLVPFFCN